MLSRKTAVKWMIFIDILDFLLTRYSSMGKANGIFRLFICIVICIVTCIAFIKDGR